MTWRPNLRGRADELVVRFLDALHSKVEKLEGVLEDLVAQRSIAPDGAALRVALQAGGKTPLNVEGLLGHLAQPQTGGAPSLLAVPSSTDPLTQDGALFVLSGAPNSLYRVNKSVEPPTFDPIGGSGSVTQVNTGTGLTGGPITGIGTVAVDTSVVRSLNNKVAGAPVTDGSIDVIINGNSVKLMTTP